MCLATFDCPNNPDTEMLREYARAKLALADQLRAALGLAESEQQCAELVVKLAEDRFTLAVLGQFKRGKSSLMNAIIGRDLLPTGVLPLTSAITTLKYGPVERLVIHREHSMFPAELPLSSLAEYITETGNPSNQRKVKAAHVELPVPFLRRGLEFVDTPGVGSAVEANTATTYAFLPHCDAVLFVTGVDAPMTGVELDFIRDIREYADKVFFVVNKTDLIAPAELDEVLGFITETIRSRAGCQAVKIFPVSARLGLAARISADAALYEKSGLKALEEAMASFLSQEKSALFLAGIARRALRILEDAEEKGAFGEAGLRNRAAVMQKDTATVLRDPYAAAHAAKEAMQRMEALQAAILENRMADAAEAGYSPAGKEAAIGAESDGLMPISGGQETGAPASVAADFKARGCPVCLRLAKTAFNFFTDWQYEISINTKSQEEFGAELGFCPLHTWQLNAMCSPHGASVGYARLAEHVARILKELGAIPGTGGEAAKIARTSRNCRVCRILRRTEDESIQRVAAMLEKPEERNRYRLSQGVCLRHLGMLMDAASTKEDREFLLLHAARRFEDDAEDMRSYAMKRDAVRGALANSDEEDAYRRAIVRIAGGRNVCVPWAEDGEI